LETGVIVETEHIDIIQKSERDKKKEEKVTQKQIDALNEELTAFKKKLKTLDDQVSKDKVRFKMMEITDEIEALRSENMDEEKFWGMLALNDDVQFDYGRAILKEGTYET
jgi:predicted  nucleic acid-binding Zn-ribbon protein